MQFSRVFKKMAKYMLFLKNQKKGLPTQKHPGEGAGLIATRSPTRDRRPATRVFSRIEKDPRQRGEGIRNQLVRNLANRSPPAPMGGYQKSKKE